MRNTSSWRTSRGSTAAILCTTAKAAAMVQYALCSLLMAVALAEAAPTLERYERDSLGRLLLYCSQPPTGWSSELSADKRRVILHLPGTQLSPQVAQRSWQSGLLREVYPRQHGDSVWVYVLFAQPVGYSLVWLPYSSAFLLTPVQWDRLTPAEDLYHSALLALEVGAEVLADSLLSEAAHSGHPDAATLAGIRALQRGMPLRALQWLRAGSMRGSRLPDLYAATALLALSAGQSVLAQWAARHFTALSGRPLPPVPSFPPDSLAAVLEQTLAAPLLDTTATPPLAPPPLDAIPSAQADSASPAVKNAQSPSGTLPQWLLVWAPVAFGLGTVGLIALLLRKLWRRSRDSSSHTPSPPPAAEFAAHVQAALRRYREAEEGRLSSEPAPVATVPEAAPSIPEPTPSLADPAAALEETRQTAQLSTELRQLWRHRIGQRQHHVRSVLQQLACEHLPASEQERAQLARRLSIAPQALELHLRLRERSDAKSARCIQGPPSFVSNPDGAPHPEGAA